MTATPPTEPPRSRLLRDLVAVLLILAGVASVIYGAFLIAPSAGWITAGIAAGVGGWFLGHGEVEG